MVLAWLEDVDPEAEENWDEGESEWIMTYTGDEAKKQKEKLEGKADVEEEIKGEAVEEPGIGQVDADEVIDEEEQGEVATDTELPRFNSKNLRYYAFHQNKSYIY